MNAKKTYIGIAVVVLVFGFIFIPKIIKRVANSDITRNTRLNHASIDGSAQNTDVTLSYISQNGVDRKAPAFEYINQHGDTISNKDYYGKVYLVEFFFTRCINICIPMNHNLQYIASQFADEERFGIASFTIDPEHDTPDVLAKYAADYGVTHPNWNFMTGDFESLLDLSNNQFYIPAGTDGNTDNYGMYHSGLFALVDQNGFLRSRLDSFGNPIIYYRGFVPLDAAVDANQEQPQIDILIADIKKLLKQ